MTVSYLGAKLGGFSILPSPFKGKYIVKWNEHSYNKISIHWGLRMVNIRGDWVLASDAWLQLETNCVETLSAMISFIEWIALFINSMLSSGRQAALAMH